jgi:hypothetical protein
MKEHHRVVVLLQACGREMPIPTLVRTPAKPTAHFSVLNPRRQILREDSISSRPITYKLLSIHYSPVILSYNLTLYSPRYRHNHKIK